jgi:hypothetical protein
LSFNTFQHRRPNLYATTSADNRTSRDCRHVRRLSSRAYSQPAYRAEPWEHDRGGNKPEGTGSRGPGQHGDFGPAQNEARHISRSHRRQAEENAPRTKGLSEMKQDPASWSAGRDLQPADRLRVPAVRTKQRAKSRPADPGSPRGARRSDVTCDGPAPTDTHQQTSPPKGAKCARSSPHQPTPTWDAMIKKPTKPMRDQ